jgi:hypothetical protein
MWSASTVPRGAVRHVLRTLVFPAIHKAGFPAIHRTGTPARNRIIAPERRLHHRWRQAMGTPTVSASKVCLIRPSLSSSTRPPFRPTWRGCAGAVTVTPAGSPGSGWIFDGFICCCFATCRRIRLIDPVSILTFLSDSSISWIGSPSHLPRGGALYRGSSLTSRSAGASRWFDCLMVVLQWESKQWRRRRLGKLPAGYPRRKQMRAQPRSRRSLPRYGRAE